MNRLKRKLTFYILSRFALWVAVFTVALGVLFLLALAFGSSILWKPGPVYDFLYFVRKNTVWFFIMCWAAGFVLIFIRVWFKTLGYLEESERAAKEAEQKKNDLLVYLAHDLKTPLTSVIGYLTLLRDEQNISEESRSKYLAVSLDKAHRLEELINEFLEITRYNLTTLNLEISEVNITRMLEQIAYEFKPVFNSKDLDYEIFAPQDLMLRCDADKIRRVFDNLIRNAAGYSYNGTVIGLSCSREAGGVTVKVRNNGKTIPREKLGKVFEQFYRLDGSRATKSGGSGLGLVIAKEIVERHGGTIKVKSENDVIEFEVVIPDTP